MKKCNKCKSYKDFVEFYKMKHASDGHQYTCKLCKKEIAKTEESKLYHKKYKLRDGVKEKRAEYNKKWYDKGGKHTVLKNLRLRQAREKNAAVLYSELDDIVYLAMVQHCKDLEKLTGVSHQIDHIVPLAHKDAGGLHTAANWQVVPAAWNLKKNNRSMELYDDV